MPRTILAICLLIISTFIGCNHQSISDRLAAIDSLVAEERHDSAWNLLKSINESQMNYAEEKAHYQLLCYQTSYLTSKPLPPDSILDYALAYYQNTQNAEKLADCYYYKAFKISEEKDFKKSIMYFKQAEKYAKIANNVPQQFKIYEAISIINNMCGNFELSLNYGKYVLVLSKRANRKDWMAYSYNRIGLAYINLGKEDSALYYFNKITPYIKYIREEDRPYFLSNLSLAYIDKNQEKSKELLLESLSYKELSGALEQLAFIHYQEGNLIEAYRLWKRALTINDLTPKDNIIHNLLEYDIEHGKIDQVCERVNEIIAIKDSIINNLKNDTIKDLQTRFDHEVTLNAANEKIIRWQWYLGFTSATCLILTILWLIKRNKMKIILNERELEIQNLIIQVNGKQTELEKVERLIAQFFPQSDSDTTQVSQQLLELKKQKEEMERECQELNEKIRNWAGAEAEKVREGALLINEVKENKSVRHWLNEQQEALIAFYFAINTDTAKRIHKNYNKLTTKEVLYLILRDMNKSKEDISAIMGVDKNTLRTYEFRTKQKRT